MRNSESGQPPDPHLSPRVFLVVVDESEEMRNALRYACRRAQHTNGRVALLLVVEPAEFQHWLGVGRVIARAASPLAARVLARIGADEVVNPEEESAARWANRLRAPNLLSQIEFHEGYSIVELTVPKAWVGRTLVELNLRAKAGLHVVAVKRVRPAHHGSVPAGAAAGIKEEGPRIEVPSPTEP